MSKTTTVIGIDPGVNTGLAIYDMAAERFTEITSGKILDILRYLHPKLNNIVMEGGRLPVPPAETILVLMEDARQRKWFGQTSREVLQGAGSIKRDCQIWEDFLGGSHARHKFLPPSKGTTKWPAHQFKALTGWTKRTNEHSRDAAVLVLHNLDLARG